ncbi:Crp/Fnr family transcriptional regulator [Ohtaekwangia sp.]|uniref:Crp/Fnr family transcriptional regulator n=1 Tax=Ohtaekwangia sp. TaxID=2066019 RepID=UPI002F95C8C3
MNELEQYISVFFGVNEEDTRKIASYFQPELCKKNDFILRTGATRCSLHFQRSGYSRFFIESPEEEITQWIAAPDSFITDLAALMFQTPVRFNIQALTDCELFTISADDYNNLGNVIPAWHRLEKLFLGKCFIFMEERLFSLLSMNMEERYDWLFSKAPSLFNQVPLQYLASMLGMTPETLSRIRKKGQGRI